MEFIHAVLTNLRFNSVFTNWILNCISSVSFEVLVNGGKSNQFKPRRGLRQGDPLLPYLFILGQEVLSRMLDKELKEGNISNAKPSIRGHALTHVMYADDIVLFFKATRNDAKKLADCLESIVHGQGKVLTESNLGFSFQSILGLTTDKQ